MEKKDWLFGFLEDAGVGEVIYAEDDGEVIVDKRPICQHCSSPVNVAMARHCSDCDRYYHVACYWRHPCKNAGSF